MCGERHCECKVLCQRTQQSKSCQGPNRDRLIPKGAHLTWGHGASRPTGIRNCGCSAWPLSFFSHNTVLYCLSTFWKKKLKIMYRKRVWNFASGSYDVVFFWTLALLSCAKTSNALWVFHHEKDAYSIWSYYPNMSGNTSTYTKYYKTGCLPWLILNIFR